MGIATPASGLHHHPLQLPRHISHCGDYRRQPPSAARRPPPTDSMSHHNFHHGFLGFPHDDDHGDDNGLQGRGRAHPAIDQPGPGGSVGPDPSAVYDPTSASSILSEILSFGTGGPSATELLATIPGPWYSSAPPPPPPAGDQDAAMQLFLMNPPPPAASRAFPGAGQGLSLSLSSSLQQLEAAASHKPDELYYAQQQQQPPPHSSTQFCMEAAQPIYVAAALRQSKYARAAQELLEEFCSVGRGQLKRSRRGPNPNPNPNSSSSSHAAAGGGGGASSSSSKDPSAPPLSAADRFEHQRKKSKLSSMLDEVERRYNHYCDQMQMVVNSFDGVMGYGAAAPYTGLARKAMSRHFRCLKDAILGQLRRTCEALGEKEGTAVTGITKGETPRLKLLDQTLRQQRTFNQMGMMEQEAWRPQRGLPERSVTILRAWLFEHFLHPYPNDADKHMLARQTGLSRNQVTNWFINARVRLWKPMVEEMYQQEAKDEEEEDDDEDAGEGMATTSNQGHEEAKRSRIGVIENDSSSSVFRQHDQHQLLHQQHHHHQQQQQQQQQHLRFQPSSSSENHLQESLGAGGNFLSGVPGAEFPAEFLGMDSNVLANYGTGMVGQAGQVWYGTSGDVSLTLGLRHAGNPPESGRFSLRDLGGSGAGGGL